MFINTEFDIVYEENVKENIEEFIVKRGIFYVKDSDEKWKGGVGKKEYCQYLTTGNLVINTNFIKLNLNKDVEKHARALFQYNSRLKNIPVLDSNEKMIYEYLRDGYDDVEDYINSLRRQGCTIGNDVYIAGSYVDMTYGELITIGDRVTITGSNILAHDASTKRPLGYSKIGKIEIGNDVFIGWRSIILPNTKIGNRVIVGAGTVVSSDVPDNSVVAGNPMEILCSYDDYVSKNKECMKTVICFDRYFRDLTSEERQMIKQSEYYSYLR